MLVPLARASLYRTSNDTYSATRRLNSRYSSSFVEKTLACQLGLSVVTFTCDIEIVYRLLGRSVYAFPGTDCRHNTVGRREEPS